MAGSTPNPYKVISLLIEQGWIPLRQVAVLLGYNELRGIYARQKGRNALPTIRIGGTERVYMDDVVEALVNVKPEKQEGAQIFLSLLRTAKKDRDRKEQKDA